MLLTGAAGWVGRSLLERLVLEGFQVLAVDRSRVDVPAGAGGITWHEEDAADVAALRGLIGATNLGHVIHAATVTASPDETPRATMNYLAGHLAMASAALELAVEAGASATFISSAAVFAADQQAPLDEDAQTHGVGPYATAKRAAELMWLEAARAGAIAQVVRLGNLFGPGESESLTRPRKSLVGRYVDAAQREGRIVVEQPRAIREWTWLPDVAGVIVTSLQRGPETPLIHAVAPEHVTDLQLANHVSKAFPGTMVESADMSAAGPRPPMISRTPTVIDVPWTPLEKGLSMMLPMRAKPA